MRDYTLIVFLFASTACREDGIEGASGKLQSMGGQQSQNNPTPPQNQPPAQQNQDIQTQQPIASNAKTTPDPTPIVKPDVQNKTPSTKSEERASREPSKPKPLPNNPPVEEKKKGANQNKPIAPIQQASVTVQSSVIQTNQDGTESLQITLAIGKLPAKPEETQNRRLKKNAYRVGLDIANKASFGRLKGHRIQNTSCTESMCSGVVELYFNR